MPTSAQNTSGLYDSFISLMQKGDEVAARDFLITHLKEFPEELRDKLTLAFFAEGLAGAADEKRLVADFQKDGLATAKTLTEQKRKLEDRLKVLDIKKSL